MGRLFDAVASLAGICHRAGYDAQAAMELEAAARDSGPVEGYAFAVDAADELLRIDAGSRHPLRPRPTCSPESSPAVIAARFQQGVVDMVVDVLTVLRDRTGVDRATLSGGVFLNSFLTSACARALAGAGFDVLQHHRVPASDAGLALGQVAVLAHSTQN